MYNIYDDLDNKTKQIQAHAVLKGGECIGRIITHYSASGNTCTAYVHEFGYTMVKGKASGYGYDKQGAAIHDAFNNVLVDKDRESQLYRTLETITYDGEWQRVLRDAGYTLQGIL